uniref:Putative peptidoglycan recognition protein la n=1 Tax=Anopheles marajoara TaxID=58244 RepID=A0A2M4BZR4_9DIPT
MIIDRSNWGSQEGIKAPLPLERPVSYVIITHVGLASKPCTDVYQCSNKMRVLQDAAIGERHLPDLPSNFYIGADGNVYVGRGWTIANSYHNRTVSVCFLGDYNRYEPADEQISALQHLLTYGVVQDVLDKSYRIVGRRQTKQTTSPGDKLYTKIMHLARWNPCGTEGYTHCGAELGYPTVWDEEAIHNERMGIKPHYIHQRVVNEEE